MPMSEPNPTQPTLQELSALLANHSSFVVFAETQPAWAGLATPEGREVLRQHYLWGQRLKQRGVLLFAGPVNLELAEPGGRRPSARSRG